MTRMKAWTTLICAWALVLATASPILAQGGAASSTGSISGQVVDGNGDLLPGVSVTATLTAQIGALTAITNEEGIYRFPSVPPGEYKLEFVLAGFSKFVREGIQVTLGFNAAVNVKTGSRHAGRNGRSRRAPRLRLAAGPGAAADPWRRPCARQVSIPSSSGRGGV